MFDRKPLGQQTEDDLTGGTYETQVFNMYAKLRGFHLTSGNTALAIHGMRSEDAEKGSTLSDGAATGKMFDDFEYLASNGMIKSYWNDNYSLIHKVNDLLDEMSQNPSLTEGDLVNKGEALFVRAFCYFNLGCCCFPIGFFYVFQHLQGFVGFGDGSELKRIIGIKHTVGRRE